MYYRSCERSMYEIRWRTKEWLINSTSGEVVLVLAVIIIIAMIIIIMTITIYWAFNMFNMALNSVFILLNIIIIKILHGRVVPVLKIRKLKQREPINLIKITLFIYSLNSWMYCISVKYPSWENTGCSPMNMAYSLLQIYWRNHSWKQVMLSNEVGQGPVGAQSRK